MPYLNNPSEEVLFGSNKIKEEHETMKLQNEEVMLKTFSSLDLMKRTDQCMHK